MTEKTAQEIIDLLTLNGRKPEHIKNGERVVYLNDAISIVRKALVTDHQPAFAVGEYYSYCHSGIIKIDEINNTHVIATTIYKNELIKTTFTLNEAAELFKPATAEQIATFQRAEHFASKGRKLDEFRVRDLIEKDGELNILGNISMEEYGDVEVDGCKLTLGKLAGRYNLIQTAEELQEVGDGKDREN